MIKRHFLFMPFTRATERSEQGFLQQSVPRNSPGANRVPICTFRVPRGRPRSGSLSPLREAL
jgi:hypothetical protein